MRQPNRPMFGDDQVDATIVNPPVTRTEDDCELALQTLLGILHRCNAANADAGSECLVFRRSTPSIEPVDAAATAADVTAVPSDVDGTAASQTTGCPSSLPHRPQRTVRGARR